MVYSKTDKIRKINKAPVYILTAGMIISMTGCEGNNKLNVIDSHEIELGYILSENVEDYLTAYDDEKERNEVIAGTILEIKGESVIEGKDYRPVGEYTVILSYKDEIEEVKVTIKDSTKPVFAEGLSDAVETYIGKKPDYASLYKAEDFDMVTVTADDSVVDYNKEGSYKVTLTAADTSGNTASKEITVKIIKASLTLDKTSISLNVKKTTTLKATIKGTDEKVTFKSSDTSVASVDRNGKITAKKAGTCTITASVGNVKDTCKVTVKQSVSQEKNDRTEKEDKTDNDIIQTDEVNKQNVYKISIPTVNQKTAGYPKGCEGVSFYMALKGKGYLNGMSIKSFMDTMPISSDDNPNNGYAGDPTQGNTEFNKGKRTTIHPEPATKWVSQFGKAKNMQGASVNDLKAELRKGNPVVVWMTSGFSKAKYTKYWWGMTVSNNHALCLVGYDEKTGEYIVNDCSSKNTGEYRVSKARFEKSYNYRKFAVAVL